MIKGVCKMSQAPLRSNVTTPSVVKCLAVNCLWSKGPRTYTYSTYLLANSLNDTGISKYLLKKLVHFLLLF